MTRDVSWLAQARYGFFMHYLAATPAPGNLESAVEDWNRRTEAFDTEKLAAQLHELNAGYFFLTIGQNSGLFCAPNRTCDAILGTAAGTSRCSRRDLVADLAAALNPYGIPLMVYSTMLAPAFDLEIQEKFESVPPWSCNLNCGNYAELKHLAVKDPRLKNFLRRWEAVHREWSERWGGAVHGWWIDGCYFNEQLFDYPDAPNSASFAAALRAGNPDSLVAFNPGVCYPPVAISGEEDYTAGETNEPWRALPAGFPATGRALYHVLTYVTGAYWAGGPARLAPEELAAITRNVNGKGGAITWDVPFSHLDGSIPPAFMEDLRRMARLLDDGADTSWKLEVEQTRPAWYGKQPGSLRIRVDSPAPLEIEDGDRRVTLSGALTYEYELSSAKRKPLPLRIRYGTHYLRTVPYRCCETLKSLDRDLCAGTDVLWHCRIRPGETGVEFEAEYFGSGADPNRTYPWRSASLEVFVAGRAGVFMGVAASDAASPIRPFVIQPDGTVFAMDMSSMTPHVTRDIPVRRKVTETGTALSWVIPYAAVPDFTGDAVYFECAGHAEREDGMKYAALFDAPSPWSSSEGFTRLEPAHPD